MMTSLFPRGFCVFLGLAGAGSLLGVSATATTLSLDPVSTTVSVGADFEVAVVISGLGNGVAPSLGAYDLTIGFDPSVLAFGTVSFGDPTWGDVLGPVLGSITGSALDASGGTVNLFGVSLDSPAEVDALQPDQFILATLRFTGAADGISPLDLNVHDLGDAGGAPLPDLAPWGASVTVASTHPVPDGGDEAIAGVLALALLTGLLGCWRGGVSPRPC